MGLSAYITTVGQALISECVGSEMVFTKAELGSGGNNGEAYCRARTALANKDADAAISRVQGANGAAKVSVQYSNAEQQTTLVVREIGIYAKKAGTADSTAVLVCYCNFGTGSNPDPADVIQPADAAQFARLYEIIIAVSGVSSVSVTTQSDAYQPVIMENGLLVGDGEGGVTAVSLSYFALAQHTHAASDIVSGELPIARGGTNASTAAQALANLGIIYSATQPTYQEGAIWLQPVD